jgi:hypothetical protein
MARGEEVKKLTKREKDNETGTRKMDTQEDRGTE